MTRDGRSRSIAISWLACTLLACADASAQARGPAAEALQHEDDLSAEDGNVAKLEALDIWLRRLVGHFKVTSISSALGMPVTPPRNYVLDCILIGSGPGVQCIAGLGENRVQEDWIQASMYMMGLDPALSRIVYLNVSPRGIAQSGHGVLRGGNTLMLDVPCFRPDGVSNMTMVSCRNRLRISAPPDSKEVRFQQTSDQSYMPPAGSSQKGTMVMPTIVTDIFMTRVPPDRPDSY